MNDDAIVIWTTEEDGGVVTHVCDKGTMSEYIDGYVAIKGLEDDTDDDIGDWLEWGMKSKEFFGTLSKTKVIPASIEDEQE